MNRGDWLWLGGLTLIAVAYWQCRGVDGSGTPATERRSVGAFSSIDVKGAIRVEASIGPETTVEVSGDDNLVPLLETRLDGDRLVIDSDKNLDPELPLVVRVTTPDLRRVDGSGSVDVDVRGLESEQLEIDISGSGDIRAEGRTGRLHIEISGSGDADATQLDARLVEIDISGSGEVELGAPEELDVEVSGSGTVGHRGNPRIRQDISGSGKIVQRGP
jgi:hypothetical protein